MFGGWFYAPFLLCLPLMLWPKGGEHSRFTRRAKYWLLIPATLFVVEYGVYFWPNAHWFQALMGPNPVDVESSTQPPLRVMTWNIHKDTVDAEAISQTIIEQDADIVAIQELGAAIATPLAIALAPAYPYQAIAPSERPDEFALFSRYPIDAIENDGRGNRDCDCQVTTLDISDQSVTLFNVHLPTPTLVTQRMGGLPWISDFNTLRQRRKLEGLLARIKNTSGPLIALGDFNASDRHAHYRLLAADLQDTFQKGGFGFGLTYPAIPKIGPLPFTPIVRLDYIWTQDRFTTLQSWTGTGATADHYFLISDLRWR